MSTAAAVLVDMRSASWTRAVADPAAVCRAAVGAALAVAGSPDGEVSIVLADDGFIRTLNRDHRGKDRATNVLAFALEAGPLEPGPRLLGDIVLAYETTAREAMEFGRTLSDRLAHLVAHATLHLIGYRHQDPAQAEAMERLEAEALARLGIADPYAMPAAVPAAAGA
jgi:probable rRNA maturation factor